MRVYGGLWGFVGTFGEIFGVFSKFFLLFFLAVSEAILGFWGFLAVFLGFFKEFSGFFNLQNFIILFHFKGVLCDFGLHRLFITLFINTTTTPNPQKPLENPQKPLKTPITKTPINLS